MCCLEANVAPRDSRTMREVRSSSGQLPVKMLEN
jgi:hypothetical protein